MRKSVTKAVYTDTLLITSSLIRKLQRYVNQSYYEILSFDNVLFSRTFRRMTVRSKRQLLDWIFNREFLVEALLLLQMRKC